MVMERENNNIMCRRTICGDLKVVMDDIGCDANFSAMVEGLDRGVVKDDEDVGEKLINVF